MRPHAPVNGVNTPYDAAFDLRLMFIYFCPDKNEYLPFTYDKRKTDDWG